MKFLSNIYVVLFLILISCDTSDNVPDRNKDHFVKYYGFDGNQEGVDVLIMDDGFVILGNNLANDQSSILLVRTDNFGNEIWKSQFGGEVEEKAVGIALDALGNFVIGATVTVATGDTDVMLLKVDADGVKMDSALFGGIGYIDVAENITITTGGDYILTGYTNNVDINKPGFNPVTDLQDIYSVRTTSDLQQLSPSQWRRVYGFPGIDRGVEVVQKNDNGFLFFGTTDRPPSNSQQAGFNIFLFPAGPDGIAVSSSQLQLFGTLDNESATKVTKTPDGGFAVIGTSEGTDINHPFLANIRSNNDFLNSRVIDGSTSVTGVSITEAVSGGFLILGNEMVNNTSNIYLTKTLLDGSVEWERSFGGTDTDRGGTVRQMNDGSIVFVGTVQLESQNKIALFKTNSKGLLSIK